MSTLGEKAQVSCATALGGTKTQVFTAWLSQGNYTLKHLWINLCKQTWVVLANCPSIHIHCAVCRLGAWQIMVPPKRSPTATPIVYPKYSTSFPGLAAPSMERKQLILTAEVSLTKNHLSFFFDYLNPPCTIFYYEHVINGVGIDTESVFLQVWMVCQVLTYSNSNHHLIFDSASL